MDGLAHTFIDQAPTTELIEAYKKNDAHCNPTLACMGSATTEGQAQQEKFAHDPRVRELLGEEERERMCACMSFAKASGGKVEYAYETVRRLKEAGVPVIMYVFFFLFLSVSFSQFYCHYLSLSCLLYTSDAADE